MGTRHCAFLREMLQGNVCKALHAPPMSPAFPDINVTATGLGCLGCSTRPQEMFLVSQNNFSHLWEALQVPVRL